MAWTPTSRSSRRPKTGSACYLAPWRRADRRDRGAPLAPPLLRRVVQVREGEMPGSADGEDLIPTLRSTVPPLRRHEPAADVNRSLTSAASSCVPPAAASYRLDSDRAADLTRGDSCKSLSAIGRPFQAAHASSVEPREGSPCQIRRGPVTSSVSAALVSISRQPTGRERPAARERVRHPCARLQLMKASIREFEASDAKPVVGLPLRRGAAEFARSSV